MKTYKLIMYLINIIALLSILIYGSVILLMYNLMTVSLCFIASFAICGSIMLVCIGVAALVENCREKDLIEHRALRESYQNTIKSK